ncbi:hypothetical protein [Marinitoga sp. 1138]|uniref:hypothetical protein n=1 Tax=Marinitoga sp. 1138 TaxID=1643334 RepID=UPI001586DF61|nr:hypothetical protein [Marinitoga sp. 1138]NUU97726.1 hypothetical protein [Marinitoga sp. 1138]
MNEYINTNEFVRYMSLLNEKGEIEILENLIEQIFEFFIDEIENKKVKKEMINFVEEVLRIIDPENRRFYRIFLENLYKFFYEVSLKNDYDFLTKIMDIFLYSENLKFMKIWNFDFIEEILKNVFEKNQNIEDENKIANFFISLDSIVRKIIKMIKDEIIDKENAIRRFRKILINTEIESYYSIKFILEVVVNYNIIFMEVEHYIRTFYENQYFLISKFEKIFKNYEEKKQKNLIDEYIKSISIFVIDLYQSKRTKIFYNYILDVEGSLYKHVYNLISHVLKKGSVMYFKKLFFLSIAKFINLVLISPIEKYDLNIDDIFKVVDVIISENIENEIFIIESFFDYIENGTSPIDSIYESRTLTNEDMIPGKIYLDYIKDYTLEILLLFIYKNYDILEKDRIIKYFKEKTYRYINVKEILSSLYDNLFKLKVLNETERGNFENFIKEFSKMLDEL